MVLICSKWYIALHSPIVAGQRENPANSRGQAWTQAGRHIRQIMVPPLREETRKSLGVLQAWRVLLVSRPKGNEGLGHSCLPRLPAHATYRTQGRLLPPRSQHGPTAHPLISGFNFFIIKTPRTYRGVLCVRSNMYSRGLAEAGSRAGPKITAVILWCAPRDSSESIKEL